MACEPATILGDEVFFWTVDACCLCPLSSSLATKTSSAAERQPPFVDT